MVSPFSILTLRLLSAQSGATLAYFLICVTTHASGKVFLNQTILTFYFMIIETFNCVQIAYSVPSNYIFLNIFLSITISVKRR